MQQKWVSKIASLLLKPEKMAEDSVQASCRCLEMEDGRRGREAKLGRK